jgi:hypothetical protein
MYGNFSPDAIEAFTEAVGEENFSESLFDFTTCERPDGSRYGTSGHCRKGSQVESEMKSTKQKPEAAKSQVSLVTPQKRGGADLDRLNKYIKEEAVKFDNQRQAIRDGKAKADDPEVKKNLELRMRNVREASKQRDQLQKEMDTAAAAQSPKRPADNSPAAQQRRSAAAARAIKPEEETKKAERQANPGKEAFDKGVRDRRENFDARTRPKDPSSDGSARAAYLKQTLDNEMKRQNRPEIVAGLKKKLAEAEGKP